MANMRISGITSGFDTDTMIKDLMKAESARVDKVKRQKQYTSWQQEGFREITNKLRTLQSNFFDVLKPGQNLTSSSSFAKYSYSVMSGSATSSKVTVSANASFGNSSVEIDSITQLASKDQWIGNDSGARGIETNDINLATIKSLGSDFEFTLSVGNDAKLIKLTQAELVSVNTIDDLKTALSGKISASFGSDYASVVKTNGQKLEFDFAGSEVKMMTYGSNSASMSALFGTNSSQSSYAYKTKSISELFGINSGDLTGLSINGKSITIDATDTIATMVEKFNKADVGVTLKYDSLKDSFVMDSKNEGSINNISVQDGSVAESFLSKLFAPTAELVAADGSVSGITRNIGKNAVLSINGTSIVQSNNTFTMDGLTLTLKETSNDKIKVAVNQDTTAIIDNIKNFVKEYNDLVDFVNGKLTEKKDYDYEPLTDEEKEALTEDEVKKWEEKAKAGMLRGSSELTSLLSEFRNAIIESVEGAGLTMSQIGIGSTSYLDRGKLTVDETKLKTALENNYDDVVALFSKESSISYDNSTNRSDRSKENGIANRFADILKDYTRTTRDASGNKGKLIMKAGIENDISQFSNEFQKKITGYDDRISDLLDYISNREEYYYTMFSKMESALSQMQSQSASLMSQLGSN